MRYLRRGSDVCILTYGVITKMAAEIADTLAGAGQIGLAGLGAYDEAARSRGHRRRAEAPQAGRSSSKSTRRRAASPRRPSRSPGIASATCRLDTFTLQDAFIHNYGSWEDLLGSHGIAPDEDLGRRFVTSRRACQSPAERLDGEPIGDS